MANKSLCSIPECCKPRYSRIHCRNHHHRFRKYGDALAGPTSNGEPKKWLEDHVGYDGPECLIWPFARRDGEYGRLYEAGERTQVYAHRVMCELAHGPAPSDLHECAHSCGKGDQGCVSPKHLRWDTIAGNAADRVEHGTENRGERNGQAKLTSEDVRAVRRLLPLHSHPEIAEIYGVSRVAISNIATGKRWGWLV